MNRLPEAFSPSPSCKEMIDASRVIPIGRAKREPLFSMFADLVKSLSERHPGESRGPEHIEIAGFRLSPE
jgi:hypothetical protein